MTHLLDHSWVSNPLNTEYEKTLDFKKNQITDKKRHTCMIRNVIPTISMNLDTKNSELESGQLKLKYSSNYTFEETCNLDYTIYYGPFEIRGTTYLYKVVFSSPIFPPARYYRLD